MGQDRAGQASSACKGHAGSASGLQAMLSCPFARERSVGAVTRRTLGMAVR